MHSDAQYWKAAGRQILYYLFLGHAVAQVFVWVRKVETATEDVRKLSKKAR